MTTSPLVRVTRVSAAMSVGALVIATGVGAQLAGSPGAWGGLLGIGLPTAFFGLTLAVALLTRRRSGAALGAVIMGSWLLKFIALVVALVVLKPLTFYDRPVFAAALFTWTVVLLAVEVRIIRRTQQFYVEPQ